MATAAPVLIAGGGIGGLATALALAHKGIASEVLERESAFSEAGAGIQLGPNAVRGLDLSGAGAHLQRLAFVPHHLAVHEGASGTVLARIPLGTDMRDRFGAPYWTAHRADVLDALLASARASSLITLKNGFDVASFLEQSRTVRILGTNGESRDGIALVAADGRWSRMRRALMGDLDLPFSGYVAYRAVIPAADVPSMFNDKAVHIWLAPKAHAVHYPVRAGREHALVVVFEDAAPSQGWNNETDPNHVRQRTAELSPQLTSLLNAVRNWRKWALASPKPFRFWSKGHVTLLGDAAHPVLPFLAQGAGFALEDAITLASCIAASQTDIPGALQTYESQRLARATRLQTASRRNGKSYHVTGFAAAVRNRILRHSSPQRLIGAYDWLYGWMPPQ
jgi:salicylate hydroxylase